MRSNKSLLASALVAVLLALGAGAFVGLGMWRRSQAPPRLDPLNLLLIPFTHAVIDADPLTGPDCCTDVLAIGDINGDGRPDVVLGAQESIGAGLVWYENPGWRRHDIARGEFTTDGKVVDLDNDGDQDVVVGELETGLMWFENGGGGANWTPHPVGASYVHDIEVGDLDGDGHLDIVTCDKNELTVWFRRSSGWEKRAVLASSGEGIALADIDLDGDLDIVFGPAWLENDGSGGGWQLRPIARNWSVDTRVRVADMNGDGRPDVVLTASEGRGRLAWFEAREGATGDWREHSITDEEVAGAHSLVVADFDRDGDLDVAVAEMHTSNARRVLVFVNNGDGTWESQTLAVTGSHNMQAADLDGDGDVEIVGKNYAGRGRAVEYWDNLTRDNFGDSTPTAAPYLAPDWHYAAIDDVREDDQQGKMGLLTTDVNGDGRPDIVAGSFLYLNPGGRPAGRWPRVRIGQDVDVLFHVDVDGDDHPDLVGARAEQLLWFEATDSAGSAWNERVIGRVPDARTQGYITAQIEVGRRDDLVFTRGNFLLYVRIPDDPESGPWPLVVVSSAAEEEGVAAADVDRDGDLDLIATAKGGQSVLWFENPGDGSSNWRAHRIGGGSGGERWLDRVVAADLNHDGLVDVLVSEETQDWAYNSAIYWFEAPPAPHSGEWKRHRISILRSVNSMDVADMDGDGDLDVIAAEHTDMSHSQGAPNNLTVVFENAGRGLEWRAHPIEVGPHSSHLGARAFDLDGDGRLDIVSLAWNQFTRLHSWWGGAIADPSSPGRPGS